MTPEELSQPQNPVFKALIRETTVYNYYVELKVDALTDHGFFDLIKVPDLYLSGAGEFLKNLRLKRHFSQPGFAKLFNVTRSRINHWENGNKRVPLRMLVKIAEACDIPKDKIYWLIGRGKFETKTALPVRFEKIRDIISYFSPQEKYEFKNCICWRITLINCTDETLSLIKNRLNVKVSSLSKSKIINSKELHNYLTTFFRYTKVPKIQPPLTEEVKSWHDEGIDLKRTVIIPCLQSDGTIGQGDQSLRFNGKSKILHDYFVDAMYYEYHELPTTYMWMDNRRSGCYVTIYQSDLMKDVVTEVMTLAGNTKTAPARGQTVKEYLKEPQPHLNYLLNAPEIEQQIALRVWAATEGSISIYKASNGRFYPRLVIGCAYPDLAIQLQQMAIRFGIHFTMHYTKNSWSGVQELHTSGVTAVIEFLKFGGFIKGVAITSNSPYHEGIDKDVLLLGILEFKKRELETGDFKKVSRKQAHDGVNKIVENQEYNTAGYYINYFSKENKRNG